MKSIEFPLHKKTTMSGEVSQKQAQTSPNFTVYTESQKQVQPGFQDLTGKPNIETSIDNTGTFVLNVNNLNVAVISDSVEVKISTIMI